MKKNWVDTAFGLGRETPKKLEGMSDKDYIKLICASVEEDQKNREKAGNLILALTVLGMILLALLLFV